MAIPTGLLGSEEALREALAGGRTDLRGGLAAAGDISAPFTKAGGQAFDIQAALPGAQGADAQGRAFENFQASPGQEFLVGEAERALLRNQGAIGGLGGGNVRRALQENAIGLASQDFANQFSRLGEIAGRGATFSGAQAGREFTTGAGLAELTAGIGGNIAGGRTQAGRDIAGIIATSTGDLSQILLGSGGATAGGNTQLATLLANLATGQASNITGLAIPGAEAGNLSDIAALLTALGTL